MSTLAAIMALPAPLDQIRLVGNEDKHATLLYFGETSSLPDGAKQTLIDSVGTAAAMLRPFSEEVIDVRRLGTDDPPALVAMLSNRCMSQMRNLFMMNPDVKSYLDNGQQFPEFTPHVTLDYPDFTQEFILKQLMRQVYSVSFDRLAVWWNDEHIEFPLGLESSDSMSMSDDIENYLQHIAVAGANVTEIARSNATPSPNGHISRSGSGFDESKVKRDGAGKFAKQASNGKLDMDSINKKLDAQWDTDAQRQFNMNSLFAKHKSEIKNNIRDIAKANGIKDAKKIFDDPKLAAEAMDTIASTMNSWMANDNLGVSPSGTRILNVSIKRTASDPIGVMSVDSVPYSGPNPHADLTKQLVQDATRLWHLQNDASTDNTPMYNPKAKLDTSRMRDVSHSDDLEATDLIGEFLEQHGVKGQRWGVTKNRDSSHQRIRGIYLAKAALGDKTYWKRTGIVAGVAAAGVGVAFGAPALLPAAVFVHAGGPVAFASMTSTGVLAAGQAEARVNFYQNVKRNLTARKAFKHDALNSNATVQQVYDSMNQSQLNALHTILGAVESGIDVSGDADLKKAWDSMNDMQKDVSYLLRDIVDTKVVEHDALAGPFLAQHGIRGMKWGVRRDVNPATGLVARTGSEDQIRQDRIAKKISAHGVGSLSNKEIQDFARRIQLQQELDRALASQTKQVQAKADGFIKSFVKKQSTRQFHRVADRAIDLLVEEALKGAGSKSTNKKVSESLHEISTRIAPKQKKNKNNGNNGNTP